MHFKIPSRIEKRVNPWLLIPRSESGSYFYLQASVDFSKQDSNPEAQSSKETSPHLHPLHIHNPNAKH